MGRSTVAAGTLPQSFAITDDGSATLSIPLTVVPGRAGVEPELSLDYPEEWPMVADSTGPADPTLLQAEVGTAIDDDQEGRTDILLHDVSDTRETWQVLPARQGGTFEVQDTQIPRPFPRGQSSVTVTGEAEVFASRFDGT